uniref:V-type proton ATPase subunit a n=1 Tax=Globodera rostochiensis TaxID=31243 RepID=A0A914ICX3_GLORO
MSLRSEPLKLCQLIVQRDAAYSCVVELGQYSLVQFKDLNHHLTTFQRTYVREVRRCAEIERCLRYLETEVVEGGVSDHIPPLDTSRTDITLLREMYELESHLYDIERDIRQFLANEAQLKRNFNDLKQFKSVYEKVETFFKVHIENTARTELESEQIEINDVGTPLTPLLEQHETPWFVAGTIDTHKQHCFERVLWRACRRTAFVRTAEIETEFEDPDTGKTLSTVSVKVSMPNSFPILIRLHDLDLVIQTTAKHKLELLKSVAFELPERTRQVHLQNGNFFVAECWVLEREMDTVLQLLHRAVEKAGFHIRPIINMLETGEMHPTYNRTNKYIQVFQNIVDSYGIASYREINPAPFTLVTFPFLFGVMFGDIGHGLILLLIGLSLILWERRIEQTRIKDEIFLTFFGGRFIIALMGLFSMYAGLMYNDTFSRAFNIFGSMWRNPYDYSQLQAWASETNLPRQLVLGLDPDVAYLSQEGSYWMGLDPVWNLAENRLNYINSLKMKMSVILGISQMTFGVILSIFNARFFRSSVNFWTVAIPSFIFLASIFVYLCVLVFIKWIFFSVKPDVIFGYYYPGIHCAPSLLIGLINMFMYKQRRRGFVDSNSTTEHPNCHLSLWYPHQALVESVLVGKDSRAMSNYRRNGSGQQKGFDEKVAKIKKHFGSCKNGLGGTRGNRLRDGLGYRAEDELTLEDLAVHQAIHTIEFVLGCISHTASYLRLWALSLAHAQLSEVLYHMVLVPAFSVSGTLAPIYLCSAFFVFFILTVVILVVMEGLSAFLHALRLHWVEFQSKFYEGCGTAFTPFSFRKSLEKLCSESYVY